MTSTRMSVPGLVLLVLVIQEARDLLGHFDNLPARNFISTFRESGQGS